MRKFLIAFLALAVLHPIYAQVIFEEYTMLLEQNKLLEVKIILNIFSNETIDHIEIPLFSKPGGIVVYDQNGNIIESSYRNGTLFIPIDFSVSEIKKLTINAYFTKKYSLKEGVYYVTISQKLPKNVKNFKCIFTLPENTIISDTNLIFPQPDQIFSDGKRIILSWKRSNIESFEIFVNYKFTTKFPFSLVIFNFAIIFLLIFSFFIYLKIKKKEYIAIGLSPGEKRVYDVINKNKKIKQKEVQKITEFSKAKLSKIVRKLAENNLIEIIPYGRTNILKIKK